MKSNDYIREEHQCMVIFLVTLEEIIKKLKLRRQIELQDLRWLFEFNREFIIKCHLVKEEALLYPALMDLGVPSNQIDLLVLEHETLRNFAKAIRGLIEDLEDSQPFSALELTDLGECYLGLMSEHLEKEEVIFYPLIEEYISIEIDEWLAGKVLKFDRDGIGLARRVELLENLNYLKDFYGIEPKMEDHS